MADALVMVNGLPGSGKSTLASPLAAALQAHLLSKDQVKEALAGLIADPLVAAKALAGTAMDTAWRLAAALPGTVVIESFWFEPRDLRFAEAGLRLVAVSSAVEVWCDVPADIAKARYAARDRSAMYEDARHLVEDWPSWSIAARPLGLVPVVRVDTTRPVDHDQLAASVQAALVERSSGAPRRPGSG